MRQQGLRGIAAAAWRLAAGLIPILFSAALSAAELPEPEERGKALAAFPGHVIGVAGRPVPAAEVTLRYAHMEEGAALPVQTDASGHFVLWADATDWHKNETCSWFLSATSAGHVGSVEIFFCQTKEDAETLSEWFPGLRVYYYGQTSVDPADFPSIVMEPAGRIRGVVLDAADQPVAGVAVTAIPDRNKTKPQSARTDADGGYRLDNLLPGNTQICVEAYPKTAWFSRHPVPITVHVPSGSLVQAPVLRWFAPNETLSIRVVGYDGQAAKNARVHLTPLFPSLASYDPVADFRTGPSGRVTIEGIYAGEYAVSAAPYPGFSMADTLTVSVPIAEVTLRCTAKTALGGEIVDDETGEPVNEFYTLLSPEDDSETQTFRMNQRAAWALERVESQLRGTPVLPGTVRFCGSTGSFRLDVPRPGRWVLQVFAPGYAYYSKGLDLPPTDIGDAGIIALRPEAEDETIRMILDEPQPLPSDDWECLPEPETDESAFPWKDNPSECPFGWLNIQVVGSNGYYPLPDPEVRVYSLLNPFHGPERSEDDPVCPPEHLSLWPRRYRVYGWPRVLAGCVGGRVGVQEVDITAATRKTVQITLPKGPVTLIGEVLVNGLIPESGEVRAMTPNGSVLARGDIAGGRFVLPDMPLGQVLLRLEILEQPRPSIPGVTAFQIVTLPRKGRLRQRFELQSNNCYLGQCNPMPVGHPVALGAFFPGFNLADISRLDDILKADSMQVCIWPDPKSEVFSLQSIAAGRYTLTAAICPSGEWHPERYAWTRNDWPGTLLAMPLALSPYAGDAHYETVRFPLPQIPCASVMPAGNLEDNEDGQAAIEESESDLSTFGEGDVSYE